MASRTEDDRSVLIEVVCAKVGRKWRYLVSRALLDQETWLPWMIVYSGRRGSGTYWMLAEPSAYQVAWYKSRHLAEAAVVPMCRLLGDYVEEAAAEEAAEERRWPMRDDGDGAWVA